MSETINTIADRMESAAAIYKAAKNTKGRQQAQIRAAKVRTSILISDAKKLEDEWKRLLQTNADLKNAEVWRLYGITASSIVKPVTGSNTPVSSINPNNLTDNEKLAAVERSKKIAAAAISTAADYKTRGVTYQVGGSGANGGKTSDCSHFVHHIMQIVGSKVPFVSTANMAKSTAYTLITKENAVAGDVMVQGGHMGIFVGKKDEKGRALGAQMGNHGASIAPWGAGGWFAKPEDLRYYRPKV